ncbi:MAG: MBL fold metallo-hydrolase [Burkholderiaceae bacterium]|nr:MBL fold metallo-hydrolase [Burkholderiaceae bacterium]
MNPALDLIVLQRGWLSSNNIVIGDGEARAVVVDTGYCTHAAQTLSLLQTTLGKRQLGAILNTHLHSDHCGGNAQLMAHFQAPLLIPPGQFEAAHEWNEAKLSFRSTGQRCERFHPDQRLMPGSTVKLGDGLWHVLAAPGHDPDSIILFESNNGTLISADALWEHGFGIVFPELNGKSGFEEVEATLDLIASLPVALVIPGHGPTFADMPVAVAEARRRLQGFRLDPLRHARYAAKALLKFHMIEVRQQHLADLQSWLATTEVHEALWQRHFSPQTIEAWTLEILQDLQRSESISIVGGMILDR